MVPVASLRRYCKPFIKSCKKRQRRHAADASMSSSIHALSRICVEILLEKRLTSLMGPFLLGGKKGEEEEREIAFKVQLLRETGKKTSAKNIRHIS